jgi:hypothetical protein
VATVRDRIKRAMRLIGAAATGETPSADELADGLTALNAMLSSWSLESLLVPSIVREEFSFIGGQQRYSVGTLGDFNTTRPVKIERVTVEIQGANAFETPVDIVNVDQWVNISIRAVQSDIPTWVYIEGTYPLEYVNFWPVPSSAANKAVLYSQKLISSFTSVNDAVSLPPGYDDAIDYNLAIRLAPEYGKAISPEVAKIAQDTYANIKVKNSRPQYLSCDPGVLGVPSLFDWRTGDWRTSG